MGELAEPSLDEIIDYMNGTIDREDKYQHFLNQETQDPWEWLGDTSQKVEGKYLFFSKDRSLLKEIAEDEVGKNFPCAKIIKDGYQVDDSYVLCLYSSFNNMDKTLRNRYPDEIPFLSYCGWKSNQDTLAGKYSKKFLSQRKEMRE